ncbi:Rho-binding antiterminator [Marinobacterium jannaschii]|uniref:Rho-binding antiterminator n=1 Tax=Marinobacterium jannaschii TaxID=64970 RepID=UPI00048127D4|nr:Rho-binding antiterminator [Marinobacterium jannaschii]
MNTQYQPINCEVHDGYELACMRHAIHSVTWLDESGTTRQQPLRFLDLENKRGEEYLIAESPSGEQLRIRLDRISSKLPY